MKTLGLLAHRLDDPRMRMADVHAADAPAKSMNVFPSTSVRVATTLGDDEGVGRRGSGDPLLPGEDLGAARARDVGLSSIVRVVATEELIDWRFPWSSPTARSGACSEGRIGIDYAEELLQPSSVDVRVDRLFRVFRNSPVRRQAQMEELTELVEVEPEEPFILHPGEFVLGSTLERITDDLVARLEGRLAGRLGPSSTRLPASSTPAGTATSPRALERRQPYDHDLLQDEDRPALVRPALRAGGAPLRDRYAGLQYRGQAGPTPSRYWKNFASE